MHKDELLETVNSMEWESWLERPLDPFVVTLIVRAGTREAFEDLGYPGEWPAVIYEKNYWFLNPELKAKTAEYGESMLKERSVFEIVKDCQKNYKYAKLTVQNLLESHQKLDEKFRRCYNLLLKCATYIWITHCLEEYYEPKIKTAVAEFMPEDQVDVYIAKVSKPEKKNAHAIMEEWMLDGKNYKAIHKHFAWLKARFGFRPGYSLDEIRKMQEGLIKQAQKKEKERLQKMQSVEAVEGSSPQLTSTVEIPDRIKDLVKEVQELVYLRLFRIDAFYELLFLAQPLLARFAEKIELKNIKYYDGENLLTDTRLPIPPVFSMVKYYDDILLTTPFLEQKSIEGNEVTGTIAQEGFARGRVKIVKGVDDLYKVDNGDILVTHMTMPSYISAMNRAIAFVTDEGGITCHAAIVAREMQKPCVIGTKHATRLFKDGDLVEVDASTGIVKRIDE